MSQLDSDTGDPPAQRSAPRRGSMLVAVLGSSVLAWAVTCWLGYRALASARETLESAGGQESLVAQLETQAHWFVVGAVLGSVLLTGVAVGLRYFVKHSRADDAKRAGQQQLAALGRMSAVLAHEIRNPLASLKGHAQLLAEQLTEGSREHRKATRVVNEAVRLEVLTNSLLDFARAGRVERQMVDPRQVLRRAVETVNDDRIEVDDSASPASFSLDPVRIEQLLVNLMRNALQADPASSVKVVVRNGDDGLVMTVQDDGPGLPDGAERIFESFRTNKTRGTGLGLSVARRVVELHQGTIRAIDLPGSGALFVATIPPETV